MKKMFKGMIQKLKEKKGATAVEYALMVALIAAVIITAVTALGTSASGKFDSVATSLSTAGSGSGS